MKLAIIIPAFNDDKIYKLLNLYNHLPSETHIHISDPLGIYGKCRSNNVFVHNQPDESLFDAIDKIFDKIRYDYTHFFLQGVDDYLFDMRFIEDFYKENVDYDIYYSRNIIQFPKFYRIWPHHIFFSLGICLPPHFGAIFSNRIMQQSKMHIAKSSPAGCDTVWFSSLRLKTCLIRYYPSSCFLMASGGISNREKWYEFTNLRQIVSGALVRKFNPISLIIKYLAASLIKLFYFRRGNFLS